LEGIFFTDANTGIIVGQTGTILRTTDGGTSWVAQTSGITSTLFDVSFTDANTGTIVGQDGIILRTTDGGTNWVEQTSGTPQWLQSVSFIDANNGLAVGTGGTILSTTDGGTSWVAQTSGTTETLRGVSFINVNTATVVGEVGTILRMSNATGIEDNTIKIHTNFTLMQNYPNPFNPSSTISYSVPEIVFVSIRVYDVLGNQVAILVNEEKPIGIYEIEFDATKLPSGIYFYKLQAGSFVETKKMVLMK